MKGTCVICGKLNDTNELEFIDGGICRVCEECRRNIEVGGQEYAESKIENKEGKQ